MSIIRRTASGSESVTWLQAVLTIAHESRLSVDEASAALWSGGTYRTYFSLFTLELTTWRSN